MAKDEIMLTIQVLIPDDSAMQALQVAGWAWWLIRTASPTVSWASALAELTVCSSS